MPSEFIFAYSWINRESSILYETYKINLSIWHRFTKMNLSILDIMRRPYMKKIIVLFPLSLTSWILTGKPSELLLKVAIFH